MVDFKLFVTNYLTPHNFFAKLRPVYLISKLNPKESHEQKANQKYCFHTSFY